MNSAAPSVAAARLAADELAAAGAGQVPAAASSSAASRAAATDGAALFMPPSYPQPRFAPKPPRPLPARFNVGMVEQEAERAEADWRRQQELLAG